VAGGVSGLSGNGGRVPAIGAGVKAGVGVLGTGGVSPIGEEGGAPTSPSLPAGEAGLCGASGLFMFVGGGGGVAVGVLRIGGVAGAIGAAG